MKKPMLYPIFFGLAVFFSSLASFAGEIPECCTAACGSSEQYGCCEEKIRDQCTPSSQPAPTSTPSCTPSNTPSGGSNFGDYTIIKNAQGNYEAIRR